jgi:hypothetical protein
MTSIEREGGAQDDVNDVHHMDTWKDRLDGNLAM